ncbi:unnamed protein product [Cochlearia groenlandica]
MKPCNPAVGGPAKSQLVTLARGPAVRSLCHGDEKKIVESTENLCIREAMVTDIILGKNDNLEGVATFFGMNFYAPSVILTTGTTFMSGKIWVGGKKVKADRDESSPYAAMFAAQDVAQRCKEIGITAIHVKLRATDGNKTKTPGPGAQSALRALARSGMNLIISKLRTCWFKSVFLTLCTCCLQRMLLLTIPTDSTRRKGGRRGRRL